MFKLLYVVINIGSFFIDNSLGFSLFVIGYFWLIYEDHLKYKKKPKNKYKERFKKITQKTTYIVDDYENNTTTRKTCE